MEFRCPRTEAKVPEEERQPAIDIPEFVMPKRLEEMLESLTENLASFVKPECDLFENKLSDFSGFIEDVKKKEGEIEDRMRNKITENKDIQFLVEQLERSILVLLLKHGITCRSIESSD